MSSPPEPIAIVGMGCVFPGAADLRTYWSNLERGVDAITDVPPGRWDPVYYDPESDAADRFYCRRGGFVDAQAAFDPLAFGVMPRAVDGAEPDQLLALQVAQSALQDAGLSEGGSWRQRAGVMLGRGAYLTPGIARLNQRVRTAQQLVEILRSQLPSISEEALLAIKTAFQAQLGPFGPDTAIGLVPNLAASRIANRLDLCGPAYTVDAACASALVAVDQACRELWSGRCDVTLAGGVHICHDVTFWSVFTQLGALSRQQQIRPFHRDADGLLIGEGAGIVVLKRLSDAERDGDRVYARLLAVGISSDGRGATLLSPRVDGQLLALQRAWETAGVEPAGLGLVEAHGTATIQGDAAELTTLTRFFGPTSDAASSVALGSVKSMIGHAMPAAGAAGLIKAALALHHGVLPPSLHCEEPHPLLAGMRFKVPATAEPWDEPRSGPRRAAVNAFGFGGINAHAVLEASPASPKRVRASAAARSETVASERWLAISASNPAALVDALSRGESSAQGGPCRLVLFDPTPERRTMAQKIVERERPWNGHDDLWFQTKGLLSEGGKIAFLFPGIEPTFEPRVDDVAEHFGSAAPPAPSGGIEETGLAVVGVSRLLYQAIRRLGIVPHAIAGHSIGEWTGMVVSGMVPPVAAQAFIDAAVPGTLEVPDVLFAAAGCSAERAAEAIAGLPGIAISHDNCPHQVILCGHTESLETALARLRDMQVLAQKLPFRSGFHSPLFEPFLAPHRRNFEQIPLQRPEVPLWSATSCAPYPADAAAVRALAVDHLTHEVRFRELTERLYADGFRFYVQVGAGNSLVGFVEDTLRGRPHLAIAANTKHRSGLAQLRRLMAAAFCQGLDVQLEALSPPERPPPRLLRLDVPLIRLERMLDATVTPRDQSRGSPLLATFESSMRQLARAQEEVVSAFSQRAAAPKPWLEPRRVSVESHPYLLDHCFYRQPRGWTEISDRYPVAPMTLSLQWLFDAAEKVAGGKPVRVLEEVRALRWLAVAPSVEIVLRAQPPEGGRAQVSLDGYAQATALIDSAPGPWSPPPPLEGSTALPITAEELYRDRWMFHGPGYQGVQSLLAWGPDGIDGDLVVPPAPGALLDNAGQLFGLWVMLKTEVDRLALPVKLDRVELFGPAPRPGERVHCAVRIRKLEEREVRADLWLWLADGRPYCRIVGWEDRRFDSDARLWEVLRWPERELLAIPRQSGYLLVTDAWRNLPSRDLLARRYLGARERAQLDALPARRQGPWLNGRIAVKDAVRDFLWRRAKRPIFPVEVEVDNDAQGRPLVRGPFEEQLTVSLAHTEGGAVARVAEGRRVGIDLERPERRPEGFTQLVLTAEERALLPQGDVWLARVWTAKEAIGKARGTGLGGDPRRLPLQKLDGERLMIDGEWVETAWDAPFVVAWCELRSEPR
jgi:acyl transferase domain-containing protein/phosphopantetheinyl transferase (holo-ACP synthase)